MAVPLNAAGTAAGKRKSRAAGKLTAVDGEGRDGAARELAALLALDELSVPLTIVSAQIIGAGAAAAASVTLSDGAEMTFASLREMTAPAKLMAEVVATTGALPKLNQPAAMRAVALLRRIAEHTRSMSEADEGIEWGVNFLQTAPTLAVDLDDQADRWAAFSKLANIDPRARHRESNISIPAASLVLRCPDGSRLVRTDWMRAYIRSIEPRMTPAGIAVVMQRVGWIRRGKEGRWKARRPGFPGELNLAFWLVPSGWDERGEEPPAEPRISAVCREFTPPGIADADEAGTAGVGISPARVRTRTRVGAVPSRPSGGEATPAGELGGGPPAGALLRQSVEPEGKLTTHDAPAHPVGSCRCAPPGPAWTDEDGDTRCAKCGRAA